MNWSDFIRQILGSRPVGGDAAISWREQANDFRPIWEAIQRGQPSTPAAGPPHPTADRTPWQVPTGGGPAWGSMAAPPAPRGPNLSQYWNQGFGGIGAGGGVPWMAPPFRTIRQGQSAGGVGASPWGQPQQQQQRGGGGGGGRQARQAAKWRDYRADRKQRRAVRQRRKNIRGIHGRL